MNTRRYPRTLDEAFGPHTSRFIDDPDRELRLVDRLIAAACAISAVGIAALLIWEHFA